MPDASYPSRVAANTSGRARSAEPAESDVSVVMTTYNGEKFVEEQLRSILSQTHRPLEIIVLDDVSTDDTLAIVKDVLATSHVPSRIHCNRERLGVVRNIEQGFHMARGPLIAFADQDDIWLPTKLDQICPLFDADPRLDLVFTDAQLIDETGAPLPSTLWDRAGFRDRRRTLWEVDPLAVVLQGEIATGATMLLRADCARTAMPFPTHRVHDSWLVLYLLMSGRKVGALGEATMKYRLHANNQEGLPPDTRPARLRRFRDERTILQGLVEQLTEAETRLGDIAEPRHVDALRSARQKFQTRANLPDSRLRRVPQVTKLALRRGYGIRNAPRGVAHDLFAVPGVDRRKP